MAQLELVAELVVDEPISTPGSAEPAAANNTPTAPAPAASRKKRGRPPADPNAQASFFCEEAGCGASYVTYGGLYQHKRKHHPWLMSDASHAAKTKLLSPVQLLESVLYTQTASYPRPQWGAPAPPSSADGPLHPSRSDQSCSPHNRCRKIA